MPVKKHPGPVHLADLLLKKVRFELWGWTLAHPFAKVSRAVAQHVFDHAEFSWLIWEAWVNIDVGERSDHSSHLSFSNP